MSIALASVVLASVALAWRPARAQRLHSPPAAAEQAPREQPANIRVLIGPETDPGLVEALRAAGTNLRADGVSLQPVTLEPGDRAEQRAVSLIAEPGVLGVFWFDVHDAQVRVLLLTGPEQAYVRSVSVQGGSDETVREAVWLIVESGSLALVSGEAPAMQPAEVELAVEPTSPAVSQAPSEATGPSSTGGETHDGAALGPGTRAKVTGGAVVSYLGEGVGSPIPWQSGLGLDGVLDVGQRVRLRLGYGALLPTRGAQAIGWRHRAELYGGMRFPVGQRVALHVLIGAGVEAQQWRGSSSGDSGWRAVALAGLDVGLTVRVLGPLSLWLEPGIGLPLNRFALVECDTGGQQCTGAARRVVLEPWRVRPRVRGGLLLRFGGAG